MIVTELHKFPVSRGRVLRHIGKDVETVAEMIVDKHLATIKAFKTEREAAGKIAKRARPESLAGVPKRVRKNTR